MTEKFKQLGISETILNALGALGFDTPTEIQEKTIPLVLEGKDLIAGASTGSGKTLAFGCGVIEGAKPDFGIQGLVLTPTRELAEQITRELRKFSGDKKLNIVPVYGGMSMLKQIEQLESAEIVVATPGRILDHLSRGTIDFQYIKTLVLDEADRMLDMGFKEDVEKIISQCPEKRQTLLYSATVSPEIAMLTEKYMNNPVEVSAEAHVDPEKLTQIYYDVEDGLKYSLLKHLLEKEEADLVMVFCNTRRNVDFVSNNLKEMGIETLPIHGGFTQDKRNKIMEMFHSNKVHVLVCTDVAARGLDIKGVSHVYNYDIPADAKEYIHRIGRTARAGTEGKVINIIASRDYDNFSGVLKNYPEFKISNEKTPYVEKVQIKWMAEKRGDRGRSGGRYGGRSGGRSDRGGRGPSRGRSDGGSRGRGGSDNRRGPRSGGDRRPRGRSESRSYGGRDRDNRSEGRRPDNRRRPGPGGYRGSNSRSRPSSYGDRGSSRGPSGYGDRSDNRSGGRSEGRSYGGRDRDNRGSRSEGRSSEGRSDRGRSDRGPRRDSRPSSRGSSSRRDRRSGGRRDSRRSRR